MRPSEILQRLLLVGSCLCVYGNPVRPPDIQLERDGDCYGPCTTLSVQEWKVGAGGEGVGGGGAAEPRALPGGTSWPLQTANRGSADAGTGPSLVGGDGEGKVGSKEEHPATLPPSGHPAYFTTAPQSSSISSSSARGGSEEEGAAPPGAPTQDKEPGGPTMWGEARTPSSSSPRSPAPPMVFVSIQTSTPLSSWGHEDPPTLSVPEPLLPDMGANLMPREDGPESLWTEATRPGGMDTAVPPSQDEATEGTMSSEALPLIFDPSEDVTSEAAPAQTAAAVQSLLLPGGTGPPAAGPPVEVDPEQPDAAEADSEGPSNAPPPPDWTSPETVAPLAPVVPLPTERQADPGVEEEQLATTSSLSSSSSSSSPGQPAMTTMVRMTTHPPVHKSRSGLEEMESEEESDEDEDEENSEESVEDESEEDLTDRPRTSPTQPPYSLIPPPPVWVQHDQGLMRSWVELIREKAGYVSGMLAPVGIGIMGALLIVGVLYSIRMIHRKRRNSFKHQRRKVRQPEQPGEPGMSRQDQAMLLADSSEDEF